MTCERKCLFPIEMSRRDRTVSVVGLNFEQNAAMWFSVVDHLSGNSYRGHVGCTEIKPAKGSTVAGPTRTLLSGGSRFRARSRDTRRPRGWVFLLPHPNGWGVVKALCPPKVAPGLQSAESPRIPAELSGVGGKGERVVTRRVGRSRDRATSEREEKPPRLRRYFRVAPPRVGDKATREGKECLRRDIFWTGYISYLGG